VEPTTIAGETEEFGENLPQRHYVPPQIPHDQVRFRTPDRSGGKPATNSLSYGAALPKKLLDIHVKINDLQQLKARIRDAVATVTPNMLQATWNEVEYRLVICRATKVAHIEIY
jgi:hypothetical protein